MRLRGIVAVLALVSTVGGGAVADATKSATPTRTVVYGGGVKPRRFELGNHTAVFDARWSVWTSTLAIGTGVTKLCLAPSAHHTYCLMARQTMAFTEPRRECGEVTFTRLSYSKWSFGSALSVAGKNVFGKTFCLWSTL